MTDLNTAKQDKINECRFYHNESMQVGLLIGSTIFNSYFNLYGESVSREISNDITLAGFLGDVPLGYFLIDSDGHKITLTHNQLRDIHATLSQLKWKCASVFYQHYLDIMALTTVEDVEAYDASINFPTTPWELQL